MGYFHTEFSFDCNRVLLGTVRIPTASQVARASLLDNSKKRNIFTPWIMFLNVAALILFIVGLALAVTFSATNLGD